MKSLSTGMGGSLRCFFLGCSCILSSWISRSRSSLERFWGSGLVEPLQYFTPFSGAVNDFVVGCLHFLIFLVFVVEVHGEHCEGCVC